MTNLAPAKVSAIAAGLDRMLTEWPDDLDVAYQEALRLLAEIGEDRPHTAAPWVPPCPPADRGADG